MPEEAALYNLFASTGNFGLKYAYMVNGNEKLLKRLIPTMAPMNKQDAEAMEHVELALLFIPGAEEGGAEAVGGEVLGRETLEVHYLLPEQFKPIFESPEVGLDIEKYTIRIRKANHRLRVGKGLHTNLNPGGNWNRQWENFLSRPSNRTRARILKQLDEMILRSFGPA